MFQISVDPTRPETVKEIPVVEGLIYLKAVRRLERDGRIVPPVETGVVPFPKVIEFLARGPLTACTVVQNGHRATGWAICGPRDCQDLKIGAEIAYYRACVNILLRTRAAERKASRQKEEQPCA